MIKGCQRHIVSDQRPVSDEDSTLILELAAAADKYIFANHDVFAAVGIERLKYAKGFFQKDFLNFFRQKFIIST